MTVGAHSIISQIPESYRVGQDAAKELVERFGGPPAVAIAYLTVNHDQQQYLVGLTDGLGPDTPVIGCSVQGVMGRGFVSERGYVSGVMGLGGSLEATAHRVENLAVDTAGKGRTLGEALVAGRLDNPRLVVLLYDPLTGADIDPLLLALTERVGCPVVGGGAGHFHGPMTQTYQYFSHEVTSDSAVAVALFGDFDVETAISTGCAPVGIEMTVTRTDGPMLLELDGMPALEVWREVAGSGNPDVDHTAALALGVPFKRTESSDDFLVRAAFGSDDERGGVVLQSAIPEGTRVMLHHRTTEDALGGTERMGSDLAARVTSRNVRAVLGFECGARAEPFLGAGPTLSENIALQSQVAPDAPWLGMLAWGEVHTFGTRPTFNNYTFPMAVIVQ